MPETDAPAAVVVASDPIKELYVSVTVVRSVSIEVVV